MRILLINSVYKVGSTGKIVDSISSELRRQGHDVFTCYGLGDVVEDGVSEKICTGIEHRANALWARISGIPFGGLYFSNLRVNRVIKTFKPDLVHVHCINSFMINVYKFLRFLASKRIKTVVTLHSEFFHTGSCGHAYNCQKWKTGCHDCEVFRQETASWCFDRSAAAWKKMNRAFEHFSADNIIITAVSPWLADRAEQSKILGKYGVMYVPNGVDAQVFHYISDSHLLDRPPFRKIVLYVAPYFNLDAHDLKGGRFIPIIAAMNLDVKFVVVTNRLNGIIGSLPDNVQLWGKAKSQAELACLYSEADATLILSRRETFSMVTAESLCCGTPVIGFKAGGPESITIKAYSAFVKYGDLDALSSALHQFLEKEVDKISLAEIAESVYSQKKMANMYLEEYRKLLPLC